MSLSLVSSTSNSRLVHGPGVLTVDLIKCQISADVRVLLFDILFFVSFIDGSVILCKIH